MNLPQQPVVVLFLGLGLILLILCGVITLTIRISFRLGKLEPPKLMLLFAVAFLQVLLGVITVFVVREITNDPLVVFGTAAGILILSGLFFLKLILRQNWKQSLRIWAVAAAFQIVLVPVCSLGLAVGFVMLLLRLYPPQF